MEMLEGRDLLSYTFAPIVPTSASVPYTQTYDINNSGAIVGDYGDIGSYEAFLKNGTGYTSFGVPLGSISSSATGINDGNQIVGQYQDTAQGVHGFLKDSTGYSAIDATSLGARQTWAVGINNNVEVVGFYSRVSGVAADYLGFLENGSGFHKLDAASLGATLVQPLGINDAGRIVGDYWTGGTSINHGFLLDDSGYHVIDASSIGGAQTIPFGINNKDQITEAYIDSRGFYHGFLLDGSGYHTIDATPLGAVMTRIDGINDSGQLVGEFLDASGRWKGFLATPDNVLPSTTYSLWSGSATPQVADAADGNPVELGVRFTPSVSGTITGLRFYKGALNTGTHVADLWSSTGTLLATATYTNETASGWQQVNFSQPVAVTAGTTYVASYHTNVGQYADNKNYFAAAYSSGPLQVAANGGVYAYGAAGTFPRSSYQASNYWVDLVLSTSTAPAVTSETPAAGATGVAVNAPLTATFNEPVQPSTISFTLTGPGNAAVPAALSYNASTNTATLTPLSSLAAATTYTATVGGATDASGHAMANPFSWTITTSATYGPGPFTIWSPPATPQVADASDGGSVELGMRFTPSVSGTIAGLRFYKGPLNTGAHVADLWSGSGQLLATATFTSETASGWQQVSFSQPVAVTAGATYVASYHTNVGQYAVNKNYFAAAYVSGPLQVPANGGVYSYGAAGSFPRNSFQASNYWVDVVLTPGTTAAVSGSVQPGTIGLTSAGPAGTAVPVAVGYVISIDTATLTPSSSASASTTGTATGLGAEEMTATAIDALDLGSRPAPAAGAASSLSASVIGALDFGSDETTVPAAGGSPSASDRVVRIRWRR